MGESEVLVVCGLGFLFGLVPPPVSPYHGYGVFPFLLEQSKFCWLPAGSASHQRVGASHLQVYWCRVCVWSLQDSAVLWPHWSAVRWHRFLTVSPDLRKGLLYTLGIAIVFHGRWDSWIRVALLHKCKNVWFCAVKSFFPQIVLFSDSSRMQLILE